MAKAVGYTYATAAEWDADEEPICVTASLADLTRDSIRDMVNYLHSIGAEGGEIEIAISWRKDPTV